jgi:hypothetical protein
VDKNPFDRAIVVACVLALGLVAAAQTVPLSSRALRNTATAHDRYAGMPAPEAYRPPTDVATTVRLQGRQRLYRFDPGFRVTRQRIASLGASSVFGVADGPRRLNGRQYVQLDGGRYSGWWVAAPDAEPRAASDFSPDATVRLGSGVTLGVRFYAGGTVRLRQPVRLDGATTFTASERASFGGRQFVLLSNGPLAGRWVSLRRARVVGNQSVTNPTPRPSSSASATPPAAAPTAAPTTDPTVAPTTAPTPVPTAVPTPAPTTAPTPAPTAAATWKGVVLLYPGTDVTYTKTDGTDYHLTATMSSQMHDLVLDTLGRFKRSVGAWSNDLVHMNLDVIEVPHPITSLDYLGNGRYWVGPRAIEADMNEYAPTGSYDSIFVVWQSRDDTEIIPVGGWGLTLPPGSWANGAGYSSVITPTALWWWTESAAPEEVFVHEWLHQVLYWNEQHDRLYLDLHAGASYGYHAENGNWRRWLSDVMTGRVWATDHYTGVSREMWAADQPTRP